MKIFNKIVWDNKEPSNKNDIWYNGESFKFYNAGNWQNMWSINSSETPIIPDITIPTPDWLAKQGEEGHIKNRTHVVLEYCNTVKFSPDSLGLGWWEDNAPFSFDLPLNGNDCHLIHVDAGGEAFDIILQEGSRIPLAGGSITDTSNYLLITEAMLFGDVGYYSGVLVVNDGAGLDEEYTITLYTRKYISEKVIPDTIARKTDIPKSLPNPASLSMAVNGVSLEYNGTRSVCVPTIYAPTQRGTTGEIMEQGPNGIIWVSKKEALNDTIDNKLRSSIDSLRREILLSTILTYNVAEVTDINLKPDNYCTQYVMLTSPTYSTSELKQVISFDRSNIVNGGYADTILCNQLGEGEVVNCFVDINGVFKDITIKSGGCIRITHKYIDENSIYSAIEGLVTIN